MSESRSLQENSAIKRALESLVVDDPHFAQLESLIAEFNIFQALGVVRAEVRHSHLLAFLLDPSQSHGLGESFLRRLLQRALSGVPRERAAVMPVDLDVIDLDTADVRREWHHIDVFVLDSRNKLAVIIENKIDSAEHSDQLQRYWGEIDRRFPTYRIIGIYLSPEGDRPSDDRYIPISYGIVAETVGRFIEARGGMLAGDVRTLLRHYEQMLKRYIVTDSEIAELCRNLYRKHRQAFDLVFEHRPDSGEGEVSELFHELIRDAEGTLVLDESSRSYVRFAPRAWESIPEQKLGSGWTKSRRLVLFEVSISAQKFVLKLLIGPGDAEVRERLFRAARGRPDVFGAVGKTLSAKWNQVFSRTFLDVSDMGILETDERDEKIRNTWKSFMDADLSKLIDALPAATWAPPVGP
jgi:hypothetical protein